LEYQTVSRRDVLAPIEAFLSVPGDIRLRIEAHRGLQCDGETPIEASSVALRNSGIPAQWAGSPATIVDALMPFEIAGLLRRGTVSPVEFASVILRRADGCAECLKGTAISADAVIEQLKRVGVDPQLGLESCILLAGDRQLDFELLADPSSSELIVLESLTSGVDVLANEPFYLEWADPPALLIVAPERTLRSPGRVRILAGPGSIHPLRGQ